MQRCLWIRSIDDYEYGIDLMKKQVHKNQQLNLKSLKLKKKQVMNCENNSLPILENLKMYRKIFKTRGQPS